MPSPLQDYNRENHDRWEVLHDIPVWERQSVMGWLRKIFEFHTRDFTGARFPQFNRNVIRAIETANRIDLLDDLGIDTDDWPDLRSSLNDLLIEDTRKFMIFLELVVKYIRDHEQRSIIYGDNAVYGEDILADLQRYLDNGSLWTIVYDVNAEAGIIERVDENITRMAEELAVDDLKLAWELAYRLTPDPEQAVEKAQKAVEDMATRAGLTTVRTSVFGNLLGDIKTQKGRRYYSVAKPSFDLANTLAGERSSEVDVNDQFADWFATGMNLIQKTHPRRHVSQEMSAFRINPDAARQTVVIATILCYFIKESYIYKLVEPGSQDQTQ